jgi:hypothetical protein
MPLPSALQLFLIGALAKCVATILTYPYIMAKVRLQWRPPKQQQQQQQQPMIEDDDYDKIEVEDGSNSLLNNNNNNNNGNGSGNNRHKRIDYNVVKYAGAIDVLKKVLKTDGISGWYRGMQAQITKAVLSQALLFYLKEYTTRYTILLFALISRLLAKRRSIKN